MASSKNWTRIQTQTRETEPYICRQLEQKTYKNWIIQSRLSQFKILSVNIPWAFQFKFHLGFPDTKTWNGLAWEIKYFMRVINRVASFCWWQILRCFNYSNLKTCFIGSALLIWKNSVQHSQKQPQFSVVL